MKDQNRVILKLALGGEEEVLEVVEGQEFNEEILDRVMTQSHVKVWHI